MQNKTKTRTTNGLDKKLIRVLNEPIKSPTQKEYKYLESLDDFLKEKKEKGKCFLWRCPICGKPIKEITSSGQIKQLLINFQKGTLNNKCKNKHRNWFYPKDNNLIFKAEVDIENIKAKGGKWFALTKEKLRTKRY